MRIFSGTPEMIGDRYAAIAESARTSQRVNKEPLQYMRAMITEEEKLDIGGAYFQDGFETGMEKGQAQKAMEIAAAMLKRGLEPEIICAVTGLSPEQLSSL